MERHQGRLVGTSGDSVLAEFPSVVEALQCAVEIQRELAARNRSLDGDRRMEFRIGLNIGDVMVEGDDIYGEGVNVAARLEQLAEPGGICISGTVYDQVHNKLTLGYDYLGERSVKNISEEVRVYRVDLDRVRRRRATAPRPSLKPFHCGGIFISALRRLASSLDSCLLSMFGEERAGGCTGWRLSPASQSCSRVSRCCLVKTRPNGPVTGEKSKAISFTPRT